ncbi:MAG: hypothetical protein KatS3mg057_3011 [Herpetosiphonaceae bacterium]|nr:MAG: hypothetical protein KatS3mg057_3011 [Herpetosiphonaceae bacterium]
MRRPLLLAMLLFVLSPLLIVPSTRGSETVMVFPETGHTLRGAFKAYWESHGGLPIFGYPITEELWEDGRLVQYFERNRFEYHPENPHPYKVLLGRLGEERLRASGRDWRTLQQGRPASDCLFFAETRHSLCGEFKRYWEANGGLAIFGYPLTEPFLETSETDGQTYLVQYFERNRFELHPENQPPYNVLLGLLGSWRAGWLLGPARDQQQYPIRATITGPQEPQTPLSTVTLKVSAPGYSGPAQLHVFDGAGHAIARVNLALTNGVGSAAFLAAGALGPHSALLLINGQPAGSTSSAYVLDAQTVVSTGQEHYDELVRRVREMMSHDVSEYEIDGYHVRGYRSPDSFLLWLRDHVYQALGYRYFERDMTSLLDYFRRAQHPDGSFDDYVANPPWGMIKGRMEVEADLEFLFVQGVYQAWQATGDDGWLRANQEAMERGIAYSTSHPHRWEPALGLVKRPFTIDTWDFEYGGPTISPEGKPSPRHWIDEKTIWGIMHGDNTGLAYALILMSRIEEYLGNDTRAHDWRRRAVDLMDRLNRVSWNGRFFTHHVHLTPVEVPGVDESRQLSLSNAYALNREVLTYDQAHAIIKEYYQRYQNRGTHFAEWYSIDPPFPAGSFGTAPGWGNVPGEYVNGGIMPLVGGELARGAFRWGQERYGFDILQRYYNLIKAQGGSYLWYHPIGNPGISGSDSLNTDGWGSSAMLAALIEGAAGVVDQSALYKVIDLAPRWAADPSVQEAQVTIRYGASFGYLSYRWQRHDHGMQLHITGSLEQGRLRLLLPDDVAGTVGVNVDGVPTSYQMVTIGESRYVELPIDGPQTSIEIGW